MDSLTECAIIVPSGIAYLGMSLIAARFLYRHGQPVDMHHDLHAAKFYGFFWWFILPVCGLFWLLDKSDGCIKGKRK